MIPTAPPLLGEHDEEIREEIRAQLQSRTQ
jgi:hypothetical protein